MQQFFNFVNKEFRHILRDGRTLLIILLMPVAQMLIFGFAITTEINHIPFAVDDQSQSETSRQFIEGFRSSKYFSEITTQARTARSDIETLFKNGQIKMALIIPANLEVEMNRGTGQVQFIIDTSDPNEGSNIDNYARQLVLRQHSINNHLDAVGIQAQIKMLYNPQLKAAYNFVPGIMGLVLMLICSMMTSISIVREKEQGTMEILLVSPFKAIFVIFSKAIPYFTIAMLDVLLILLMSYFVFEVPIVGSIGLIFFLSILFTFASLSIGILVSTMVDTQQVAMLIAGVGLMLPTMLLSGLLFAIENMPLPLQVISNIIPAKWFIMAIKDVMIKGLSFDAIWIPSSILLGMIVVLLTVSIRKFSDRLI